MSLAAEIEPPAEPLSMSEFAQRRIVFTEFTKNGPTSRSGHPAPDISNVVQDDYGDSGAERAGLTSAASSSRSSWTKPRTKKYRLLPGTFPNVMPPASTV